MWYPIELKCPECNGKFFISTVLVSQKLLRIIGYCLKCKQENKKDHELLWEAEIEVLTEYARIRDLEVSYPGKERKFFVEYEKQMKEFLGGKDV